MNDESKLAFLFEQTSNFHIKIPDFNHSSKFKQVQTRPIKHTKSKKSQIFYKNLKKIKVWGRPTWHHANEVADKAVLRQNRFLLTGFRQWHRLLLTGLRQWHRFLPKEHVRFSIITQNSRRAKNQVRNAKNFTKADESTSIQSAESRSGSDLKRSEDFKPKLSVDQMQI